MNKQCSVCKNCGRSYSQQVIKPNSNHLKFRNSSKTVSTQTISEDVCKEHNQQITQLLTEVAIALRHKAKLENQLSKLKAYITEMEQKIDESKENFVQETGKLKKEALEANFELSSLKITYLGEKNNLLHEVSNLKTQLQELNHEKEVNYHEHLTEKNNLEQTIIMKTEELNKEAEKNVNLKLKVSKYKTKFKNFLSYLQSLLDECKENKSEPVDEKNPKNQECGEPTKVEINLEDMVLTELFFKPNPFPKEVKSEFFSYNQPF